MPPTYCVPLTLFDPESVPERSPVTKPTTLPTMLPVPVTAPVFVNALPKLASSCPTTPPTVPAPDTEAVFLSNPLAVVLLVNQPATPPTTLLLPANVTLFVS